MIDVVLVGILRQYGGGQERLSLEGWAGRSVRQMLASLHIPSELVGAVLIGGQLTNKDDLLRDGQEIKLIPLIGGG